MAALPPEALAAVLSSAHKVGLQTDPNAQGSANGSSADPAASSTDSTGQAGAAPTGDPSMTGGGADPQQQAVWTAFPGTDPNAAASLGQGGDMQEALSALLQQQEQDRAKLDQMHSSLIDSILGQLSPPGADQSTAPGGPALAAPGVGGATGGY